MLATRRIPLSMPFFLTWRLLSVCGKPMMGKQLTTGNFPIDVGISNIWLQIEHHQKLPKSMAVHRICILNYNFVSRAISVRDGYVNCEVLDRCCPKCFMSGILSGGNWYLFPACLQICENVPKHPNHSPGFSHRRGTASPSFSRDYRDK